MNRKEESVFTNYGIGIIRLLPIESETKNSVKQFRTLVAYRSATIKYYA